MILREIGVRYGQGYLYAKPGEKFYLHNRARLVDKPNVIPAVVRPRA
jgi:EAL domain-containing protein (putative c-di-GMP-specific phosphodiesterase class I)